MDFYVIIPGHNESGNIGMVLEKTKKFCAAGKIVVVDDGSRDGTAAEAGKHGVTVLRHAINLGKGAALRTGGKYCSGRGAEALVFMDSDGQHDPEDLPRLLEALKDNDIVFTFRDRNPNRLLPIGPSRMTPLLKRSIGKRSDLGTTDMPFIKKIGNTFINAVMKLLFHINVKDTQCGYKAMTRMAYEKMQLMSNDYSIESEIAAKTGKYKLKFAQLPIKTVYADRYKGTTVFDGVKIVLKMLWWKVAR
jgi:glycosyltransferase involved in cell wall biosynthesis